MNTCVVSFRIKRITRVCSEPSACPLHVPPPPVPSACPLHLSPCSSLQASHRAVISPETTDGFGKAGDLSPPGRARGGQRCPRGFLSWGRCAESGSELGCVFPGSLRSPVWGHRRARDTQGLPWSGRPAGLSCVACDVPAETRSERTGASLSSAPQVSAPARALHGAPAWPPACERDTLRRRRHQGGVGS